MNQEEKYKNFSCKICLEVANEPVITPCGHMYCWTCLYNWAAAKQPLKCPYCSNVFELNKVTTLFTGESKNKDIPPRPTNPRTEQPTPPQQNQNNFNVSFGFGFPFMMFSTMNVGQVAPAQMRNVMLIFAVGFMLLNLLSYTTPTTTRSRHFEQTDNSNILWGAVMCAGFAGLSYFARKIMNP